MKRLLMTSAVAICSLGLVACGPSADTDSTDSAATTTDAEAADAMASNDPDGTGTYGEGQVDRYGDLATTTDANTYQLAATEFEVSDLVGLDIASPTGEKIASVSDLTIGDDGKIDSIIFANGGIAGLGSDHGQLSFEQAKFAIDEQGDARVVVSMTEEGLESVAEWKQAEVDDYSLATEITGTEIELGTTGKSARVVNLLADMDGSVKYAVVTEGLTPTLDGEGYVVPFSSLIVEQGDGGLRLDVDPATLTSSPVYRD